VHTKILSGSLDPELDLTSAQRRKALAGRVLEAAGKAKLGKGESMVRAKEHNKAAKHIRDGVHARQKERMQKELEEVRQECLRHRRKCGSNGTLRLGKTYGELPPDVQAAL
jgi:hypothetical protein